jgi:hypothetical protein
MLQITLQQISITLGISHVISPTFKYIYIYPRLGNYGWGGPPNYTTIFNEGFYNEEMHV